MSFLLKSFTTIIPLLYSIIALLAMIIYVLLGVCATLISLPLLPISSPLGPPAVCFSVFPPIIVVIGVWTSPLVVSTSLVMLLLMSRCFPLSLLSLSPLSPLLCTGLPDPDTSLSSSAMIDQFHNPYPATRTRAHEPLIHYTRRVRAPATTASTGEQPAIAGGSSATPVAPASAGKQPAIPLQPPLPSCALIPVASYPLPCRALIPVASCPLTTNDHPLQTRHHQTYKSPYFPCPKAYPYLSLA